jgi:hypothetical protein
MTSCPKTETCHPEDIRRLWHSYFGLCGLDRVRKQNSGGSINEMVIYRFHYVIGQRRSAFPAPSRAFRSCSKESLLSSTEV